MRLHRELRMTRIISAMIFYAGICSSQPTHITRHCGWLDDSSNVALLNKIDRALRDATSAATSEIATKVDRQTVISAITQSDVQQLSRFVGQSLTSNISDLSTAAARSANGLHRVIQMLTEVHNHISTTTEDLHDFVNTTLRHAETKNRDHESHIWSNLTATFREAWELLNETRLCTKTDQLLSQSNESIGILKRLPTFLQSVIITAHENASANQLNHALGSFNGFDVALNQSQRSMNELQQLTQIFGQILTRNISDLSTAVTRNAGGLQQVIQMLTEVSTHMSSRIELLHEIFNISLRKVQAAGLAHESNILSNLTRTFGGAFELLHETRQCTRTVQLLSQFNVSIAILQKLPGFLQSVIVTAYENASAVLLNHGLRSYTGFNVALNQSRSNLRELSVNLTQSVSNILSRVNSIADSSYQHRELMTNVSLENKRLLQKVERILFLFDNASITTHGIRLYGFIGTNVSEEDSPEDLCSPYDTAKRTAKIRTTHIRQQWTKKIAEMQDFSEYLSPATSRIMQGPRIYAGCQDAFRQGIRKSDVYDIIVFGMVPFRAWCDFDSRGGWMVMQRRFDGTVDFFKRWADYVTGFGNLWGEHWLGLEKLQQLTRNEVALSIHVEAFDTSTAWANYSIFRVYGVSVNYRLAVSGYSGTTNSYDSLSYSSGCSFSTRDRDNDGNSGYHCALSHFGAWWHRSCTNINLNGLYQAGSTDSSSNMWYGFKGYNALKATVMRMLV